MRIGTGATITQIKIIVQHTRIRRVFATGKNKAFPLSQLWRGCQWKSELCRELSCRVISWTLSWSRHMKFDLAARRGKYPEILEWKLKAGRFLGFQKVPNRLDRILIVNEEFMSTLRFWAFPFEGKALFWIQYIYQIVGVVAWFFIPSFSNGLIWSGRSFRATDESTYGFLTLEISPGSVSSSMGLVKGKC